MRDHDHNPPEEPADFILLAQVGRAWWLLEGEAHLNALLSNLAPYPKPVRCLRFETELDLRMAMPEGLSPTALWSIHPGIVDRLIRNDELLMLDPAPPSDPTPDA